MSKLKNGSTNIGVACFHRDQWQLLLNTAKDVENLESTWKEWKRSETRLINERPRI